MTDARPFVIGKVPSVGDFFSRGLDPDAALAWDGWSAAEIESVQVALGPGFERCHECVPPLRFILGRSALPGWAAGAITPSVDAAGRRFLLAAGICGLSAEQAAALGSGVARDAEGALYDIIGDRMTPDAGLERVRAIAPEAPALSAAQGLGAVIPGGGAAWCEMLEFFEPAEGLQAGLLTGWMHAVATVLETAP